MLQEIAVVLEALGPLRHRAHDETGCSFDEAVRPEALERSALLFARRDEREASTALEWAVAVGAEKRREGTLVFRRDRLLTKGATRVSALDELGDGRGEYHLHHGANIHVTGMSRQGTPCGMLARAS